MAQKIKYILTLYCEMDVEPEDELSDIVGGITDMAGDSGLLDILRSSIIITERDGEDIRFSCG